MTRRTWYLGLVAAVALLAAACGGGGGDDDDGGGFSGDEGTGNTAALDSDGIAATTAAPSFYSLSDAAESKGSPAGAPGEQASLGLLDRKIIFTASLVVEAENVQASFLDAGNVARSAGGFVESSNLSFREGKDGEQQAVATITMRIPATKYDSVLNDLRGLTGTKLTREESGSTEVTEEYTDLKSRLRNLERSEAQYLELLGQAKTIAEILTVNDRIDGVRAQIEQIQGRLQVLDDLTELATVSLYIEPITAVASIVDAKSGPPAIGEAFGDAWSASVEIARYLAAAGAVVSVAAIWLAVPVVAVVFGARKVRRHPPAPVPATAD